MNLSALAARCAQVTPNKLHVALPLLIIAVLYWLSSLPGTPRPDDPAPYALLGTGFAAWASRLVASSAAAVAVRADPP